MARTAGVKRVAIVYHYWAHYREPIARQLCQQTGPSPEYVLVSGITQETAGKGAIATVDPAKASLPLREGGLRWQFVKNVWLGKVFLWQTGLIRLAVSARYDAIIYLGSMYFLSTWCSAIVARLFGKKVLMWSHGYLREEVGLRGFLRKTFYRLSDGMLLYGHRARRIMIGTGFPESRLFVIYNSLDYEKQKAVRESVSAESVQISRRRLFAYPEYPVLFFIGRLTHRKRLDMLLDAVRRLHVNHRPVNLLFIGGGPAESSLRLLASESGLPDWVHFHGPCYGEDELGRLIMSADICVSPGEVGLTAIHSMAYGKPVITHDDFSLQMPEFESIVPGETGGFFAHGDTASLAATIAIWTANRRFAAASTACISIVEQYYNPSVQARIINRAVQDLLEGSTG